MNPHGPSKFAIVCGDLPQFLCRSGVNFRRRADCFVPTLILGPHGIA
jgi:hypothetical protein